jgi:hypothetical protein
MTKSLFVFGFGAIIGALLLAVQIADYNNMLAIQNEQLDNRITELERLLADAIAERPEFVSVPTQADREELDFPDRPESLPEIETLSDEQRAQIAATGPIVSAEFLARFEASALQTDLLNNQLLNDVTPAMETVQNQALSGNFTGFFQVLEEARLEVSRMRVSVDEARNANQDLGTYIDQTGVLVTEIVAATEELIVLNNEYFETLTTFLDQLEQTLTGNIPSQELFSAIDRSTERINSQTVSIANKYTEIVSLVAVQ